VDIKVEKSSTEQVEITPPEKPVSKEKPTPKTTTIICTSCNGKGHNVTRTLYPCSNKHIHALQTHPSTFHLAPPCHLCGGSGYRAVYNTITCSVCGGKGKITVTVHECTIS
jgi:DnaJ-class molecular chaperone